MEPTLRNFLSIVATLVILFAVIKALLAVILSPWIFVIIIASGIISLTSKV